MGACTRTGDVCVVATDADCAPSWTCRDSGACYAGVNALGAPVCTPRTDADCNGSALCAKFGACKLVPPYCHPAGTNAECKANFLCGASGFCTSRAADGVCVALSDADCKHLCADWGECAAVNFVCSATSDALCKASSACRQFGRCRAIAGFCLPGSDADCKASDRCKSDGNCVKGPDLCEKPAP